jgi:hypothetical protein
MRREVRAAAASAGGVWAAGGSPNQKEATNFEMGELQKMSLLGLLEVNAGLPCAYKVIAMSIAQMLRAPRLHPKKRPSAAVQRCYLARSVAYAILIEEMFLSNSGMLYSSTTYKVLP